ncbi:MAG: DUF3164 family protein [Treponema sp.]|nr:DUF3164 family protein [Treponema sp.]
MSKSKEFMTNTQGHQVPLDLVTDIDKLRDETVRSISGKALKMREQLASFKQELRDELFTYLQLSSERYGKTYGGKKGNVSLMSFDGSIKLMLSVNENIVFDERLQIAKNIIDDCINKWSKGSRSEIRALVNNAFYVDKAGNINTARILGLRRLDITDPDWKKAMEAITESIQVSGSKEYLRVYIREETGEYKQVPLDIAAL